MHSSTSTFTFILAFASVISASPILHSAPQTAHSLSERSLPSGWKYMGCIAEPSGSRLLTTKIAASPSMTQETCVSLCVGANYGYAGLEFGTECWCGNKPTAPVKVLPDASCSTPCAGNPSQKCGQNYIASLFGKASSISNTWSYTGCYSDSTQQHTLPSVAAVSGSTSMSNTACQSSCQQAGFIYGGTESGNQCWCSDSIVSGSKVADSMCSTPCPGDSSSKCGGSGYISVYNRDLNTAWTDKGCYLDDGVTRTLSGPVFQDYDMTQAKCEGLCTGYAYAGTEFSINCYCGNALTRSIQRPAAECNSPCGGDSGAVCGGNYRLTLSSTTA